MNQELQGEVVIHLSISESGDVESAERVSGDPLLAKAAADAMKTWKFKPYIKDGHPVKVSTKMRYDFAFKEKVKDITPDTKDASEAKPSPSLGGAPSTGSDLDTSPSGTAAGSSQPVSVAEGVARGMLIHMVHPVYPPSARMHHIEGTVVLQGLIGKDGKVKNLAAISGLEPLTSAAIGAVQQWPYKPYLVNGQPVEVLTKFTVNFTLRP